MGMMLPAEPPSMRRVNQKSLLSSTSAALRRLSGRVLDATTMAATLDADPPSRSSGHRQSVGVTFVEC
jgi:hypothetical protein